MEPMEQFQNQVRKLIELVGFNEPSIDFDLEAKKIFVFVNEGEWFKELLPKIVSELDHLVKLLAKKEQVESFFVDVNNYRKERERIIVELAKAAAKKALTAKEEVRLPTMNAYERRLVHVELSIHPEVKTESVGEGRERCVIVKPLL